MPSMTSNRVSTLGMEIHKKTQEGVYDIKPTFTPRPNSRGCSLRNDDSGIWNFVKAWYLFLIHLFACILFLGGMISIDNQPFKIGSGPSWFTFDSTLYQTQVTGLISLALVVIRIIAGCCTAPLTWRVVYILLEKRTLSLAELARLSNSRLPPLPMFNTARTLCWSTWAAFAIVLLWLQTFAAPLASSSVGWRPGTRLLERTEEAHLSRADGGAWFDAIYSSTMRILITKAAGTMVSKDPYYAFGFSEVPLRRNFDNTTHEIPTDSRIDIETPYIEIKLQWLNASSRDQSKNIGDPAYSDDDPWFENRIDGAVAYIREEPWDVVTAIPHAPTVFTGKKLLALKSRTLEFLFPNIDGLIANESSKCPTYYSDFGRMPPVEQYQREVYLADNTPAAYDCWLLGEATITAGTVYAKDCVVHSTGMNKGYATKYTALNEHSVHADWLTTLALDFTSEALKWPSLRISTGPWMAKNVDDYVIGMLTLGYHSAWSALSTTYLPESFEMVTFNPAKEFVFASISRARLYDWLAMNLALTLSGVIVLIAQVNSKTKTIRDSALAAVMLDMRDISHGGQAEGLCNAVTLSRKDKKSPRLKWAEQVEDCHHGSFDKENFCQRRVVFVRNVSSTD